MLSQKLLGIVVIMMLSLPSSVVGNQLLYMYWATPVADAPKNDGLVNQQEHLEDKSLIT